MDYVPSRQASRAGNCGLAQGNRCDSVAFILNRRTAFHANRARDSAAQHQVVVRRIDDRIDLRVRQVALAQSDLRAPILAHGHDIIAPTVWTRKTTALLLLLAQIGAILVTGCDSRHNDRSPSTIQVDIETSPTST